MARELVLKILVAILNKGAYSNIELNRCFRSNELKPCDVAFITEIVYGVLKYKERIDYVIAKFSRIKLKKMSCWIINILRIGVYQMLFMDKVPVSAAVNESVKLAKRYGHVYSARFVNGVLRNVSRKKSEIEYPSEEGDGLEYLSVWYSYPMWIVKKCVDDFGYDFAKNFLKSSNEKPKFCVRVNTTKITLDKLLDMFCEQGVSAVVSDISKYGLILDKAYDIVNNVLYKEGYFTIQDESSMLVADVLNPKCDDVVVDVCAAPGGKTTHIAQMMNNTGVVYAQDLYLHKVKLIDDMADRLGLGNVRTCVCDATTVRNDLVGCADKVLVDAPCTGLGIMRRKPDIRWRKDSSDIESIVKIQYKILDVASKYLKEGGSLVYSTCTVTKEENLGIIKKFVQQHNNFVMEDITGLVPDCIKSNTTKEGYIEFYPNVQGTDGFFISKLKKISRDET